MALSFLGLLGFGSKSAEEQKDILQNAVNTVQDINGSSFNPGILNDGILTTTPTLDNELKATTSLQDQYLKDGNSALKGLKTILNNAENTLARSEVDANGNLVNYNVGEKSLNFTPISLAEKDTRGQIVENPIKETSETNKVLDTLIKATETKPEEELSQSKVIEGEQVTSPVVEPSQLSIEAPTPASAPKTGDTSAADFQGNRSWELAKEQSKQAFGMSLASAGMSIIESLIDYKANKKNLKFEKEMTEKQLDTQLSNYEAALADNLSRSFADIDSTMAGKNVDISSQAITSLKDTALENMGKDVQAQTQKTRLQKAALNLQYTYNKNQLKNNLFNSFTKGTLSAISSYNQFKSFDTVEAYMKKYNK